MDRFRRPIAVLATFLVAASVAVGPPASARRESSRLVKLDRRVRVAERRIDRRLAALEERIASLEGAALPIATTSAPGRSARGGGITARSLDRRLRRLERRTQGRLRQLVRRVGQLEAKVESDTASSSTNIEIGGNRAPGSGHAIRRRARRLQRRAGLFIQEIRPRIVVLEEGARAPSPPLDSGDGPPEGWNGSAGPSSVTCPQDAIKVTRGSLQTAINDAGVGASLCIGRGVHRLTNPLSPKSGQTLTFEPGAVLNGSEAVTDWTQEGDHWVAGGQTQRFDVPSWMREHMCDNSPAACIYEDVYMDDEPLRHVTSRGALGPGRVYFDEGGNKIYIATDPRGHTLEATVATTAISSGADGVSIRGAMIEKFADTGILVSGADNWTISNSEIRDIHFQGIGVYRGMGHMIRDTRVHRNGVIGMTALEVSDFTVLGSEFAHNNYLNAGPETGGYHEGSVKILKSQNVVVRNNYSHHNHGDGWWFDSDNIGITIEGNLLENNQRHGIHYEASFDAVIRTNTIRKNGFGGRWDGGTAIFNSTSKNVVYFGNRLEDNLRSIVITWQSRGRHEVYGERQSANLLFHNNRIIFPEATHRSMWIGVGVYPNQDPRAWTANNRFENNHYQAADMSRTWWQWSGGVTWEKWQSRGFDNTGSYSSM